MAVEPILVKELKKIGLADKEAKVYLATLELGYAPIQKISEKAAINRATTYVIMDQLIAKGIAAHFNKGKKRFFVAEYPEKLLNLLRHAESEIEEKKKNFREVLPQLKSLHNLLEDKPKVMFYEGIEGLKNMQADFLKAREKELLSIHNMDDVSNVFSEEHMKNYREKRVGLGIKIKGIYTRKDGPLGSKISQSLLRNSLYVPFEKFKFSSDISIYDDKVAIASLKGKLAGVIIENQNIADTLREVFELAWKGALKEENK
jgi:sugar-specific transcriptional regulator TrmB